MKRWILAAAGILLSVGILLSSRPLCPEDYSGTWYAESGEAYIFQHGMITCAEGDFAGAYSFDRDSVVLFVREEPGMEKVCELYLKNNTLRRVEDHSVCMHRKTE